MKRGMRAEFSDRLVRDMPAHRTAALQAAMSQNPKVALVATVHAMAMSAFGSYNSGRRALKISIEETDDAALAQLATDYHESKAVAVLVEAHQMWGDQLPGESAPLLAWLSNQPQVVLLDALAFFAARSINVVRGGLRLYEFLMFGRLDVQLPEDFIDVSWHKNTCPSFELPSADKTAEWPLLTLFIDYKDQDQRECDDAPRFFLYAGSDLENWLVATEDWSQVQQCIAAKRPHTPVPAVPDLRPRRRTTAALNPRRLGGPGGTPAEPTGRSHWPLRGGGRQGPRR
jgi:hypothetical protein